MAEPCLDDAGNLAPRRPRPRNPNGHQGSAARIQRNRVLEVRDESSPRWCRVVGPDGVGSLRAVRVAGSAAPRERTMLPVASSLVTMLMRSVVSVWRQCHCAIVVVQSRPATWLQSSLADGGATMNQAGGEPAYVVSAEEILCGIILVGITMVVHRLNVHLRSSGESFTRPRSAKSCTSASTFATDLADRARARGLVAAEP